MSLTVKIGGTVSGGTDAVLASSGSNNPNKVTLLAPDSTRFEPKLVEFLTTAPVPQGQDLGTARAGIRIVFASRQDVEGCCTTKAGNVIFDGTIRWPLSQPVDVVDDVIDYIRGVVWSPAFREAIVKGVLPE